MTQSVFKFQSGDHQLTGHLARPERIPLSGTQGIVLCHGFPVASIGAKEAARSYDTLADRIADSHSVMALASSYRGCGDNPGHFSLQGWLDDTRSAVRALAEMPEVYSVSLVGFGTGGAIAICAAAKESSVGAVATLAAPADFDSWAKNPDNFLEYCRGVGVITEDDQPEDLDAWKQQLSEISAVESASEVAPRPLLIIHGDDDDSVPLIDARMIADSHGTADLRVITGAGHLLRYDPRSISILLGWVERQQFGSF